MRSHEARRNKWSELFYACRTAFRTPVGLCVAEFLLPILVLDRICFGDGHDEQTILSELREALTFGAAAKSQMCHSERQKVASTILDVIDTFQGWSEVETEARHDRSRASRATDAASDVNVAQDNWPLEESVMRIDDVLQAIPLSLRANAAANAGMHARALRLFEMLARSTVAPEVFDASCGMADRRTQDKRTRSRAAGKCPELDFRNMLETLATLNEYETMACLEEDENMANPLDRLWGNIKQKEARMDWDGALQDYERAFQLDLTNLSMRLREGSLRCLLELGRFDSVLNQVSGLLQGAESGSRDALAEKAVPIAIEASWRLGNWDSLSSLVTPKSTKESHATPLVAYDSAVGSLMLDLKNKDLDGVVTNIRESRRAVMDKLSIEANDGYSRAYESLIQLQALREIEDVSACLCNNHAVSLGDLAKQAGLSWDQRLCTVSSFSASAIINVRLVLARLAGDASFEGDLFLNMGRRARKNGFTGMADSAFAQAEAAFDRVNLIDGGGLIKSSLQLELAKLKHDCGQSSAALRMLNAEDVENLISVDQPTLLVEAKKRVARILGTEKHGMNEEQVVRVLAENTLQSTQWMIEGGLKGGTEIITRFRLLQKLAPKSEEGKDKARRNGFAVQVVASSSLQMKLQVTSNLRSTSTQSCNLGKLLSQEDNRMMVTTPYGKVLRYLEIKLAIVTYYWQ